MKKKIKKDIKRERGGERKEVKDTKGEGNEKS
jgi:hypothetical protein